MKLFLYILGIIISLSSLAQGGFTPSVGQIGTDAIYKDSSVIKGWANSCVINRGYQNILNKNIGFTSVGDSSKAVQKADNIVVSLGDSGVATLQFEGTLFNGPGPDFAVFENGFDDYFLELAFVEVSSDGIQFFRFPAESTTDTNNQVNSFDSLNATHLNNLAGKYRGLYGVPFDLELMRNINGLDINRISHVRIVDVVGTLNSNYASRDYLGRIVNDPFPTPFPSGGFDLDAVGAIHLTPTGINEIKKQSLTVYPNPSNGEVYLSAKLNGKIAQLYTLDGRKISELEIKNSALNLNEQSPGIYNLVVITDQNIYQTKLILQ